MSDPDRPQAPSRPQRLRDPSEEQEPNDLNDREDPFAEEEDHGRIGYGRLGEWSPYFLAALIILTIIVIAIVNQRNNDNGDDPSGNGQDITAPVARGPAPEFSVKLFNGETFDLAAHRGKIVVINFWASWCEPCKDEMPALQEIAQANPSGVVVIGIAASTDKLDKATSFANDLGATYPLAMDSGGSGPTGDIAAAYQVFGYPATYFVNTEGQIVDAVFGQVLAEDLQAYIDRAKST